MAHIRMMDIPPPGSFSPIGPPEVEVGTDVREGLRAFMRAELLRPRSADGLLLVQAPGLPGRAVFLEWCGPHALIACWFDALQPEAGGQASLEIYAFTVCLGGPDRDAATEALDSLRDKLARGAAGGPWVDEMVDRLGRFERPLAATLYADTASYRDPFTRLFTSVLAESFFALDHDAGAGGPAEPIR